MKKDFSEVDAAILATIKGGRRFAHNFETLNIRQACAKVSPEKKVFRMIDRRLQAMRKAGQIKYDTKTGWAVVEPITSGKEQ